MTEYLILMLPNLGYFFLFLSAMHVCGFWVIAFTSKKGDEKSTELGARAIRKIVLYTLLYALLPNEKQVMILLGRNW